MTAPGVLRLTVPARAARIIGQIVMDRAMRCAIDHTPLRDLPSAGRKLLRAATRNRTARTASPTTMTRQEGLALFAYVSWFLYEEGKALANLTSDEDSAIVEVAYALAVSLRGKPGPAQQSVDDAAFTVDAFDQDARGIALRGAVDRPDVAYVERLRKRLTHRAQSLDAEQKPFTELVQALIAKNYP